MTAVTQDQSVKAAPRDKAVCLCAKVRTNEFMAKVTEHQAFTVDEAREVTGANTGCGACYETVEMLVTKAKAEASA